MIHFIGNYTLPLSMLTFQFKQSMYSFYWQSIIDMEVFPEFEFPVNLIKIKYKHTHCKFVYVGMSKWCPFYLIITSNYKFHIFLFLAYFVWTSGESMRNWMCISGFILKCNKYYYFVPGMTNNTSEWKCKNNWGMEKLALTKCYVQAIIMKLHVYT